MEMTVEEAIKYLCMMPIPFISGNKDCDIEESQKYSIAFNMAIESIRDIEEIAEVLNCDADAEIKLKMIFNIIYFKPHKQEEREGAEPCADTISRQAVLDKKN